MESTVHSLAQTMLKKINGAKINLVHRATGSGGSLHAPAFVLQSHQHLHALLHCIKIFLPASAKIAKKLKTTAPLIGIYRFSIALHATASAITSQVEILAQHRQPSAAVVAT